MQIAGTVGGEYGYVVGLEGGERNRLKQSKMGENGRKWVENECKIVLRVPKSSVGVQECV